MAPNSPIGVCFMYVYAGLYKRGRPSAVAKGPTGAFVGAEWSYVYGNDSSATQTRQALTGAEISESSSSSTPSSLALWCFLLPGRSAVDKVNGSADGTCL